MIYPKKIWKSYNCIISCKLNQVGSDRIPNRCQVSPAKKEVLMFRDFKTINILNIFEMLLFNFCFFLLVVAKIDNLSGYDN